MLWRQPFPGPGLAVRCLGAVTKPRLDVLRAADAIVEEEIRAAGLYESIWQSFGVLLPVRTVGVMGDERTYEETLALRAVHSRDGMTADWVQLPYDLLGRISTRDHQRGPRHQPRRLRHLEQAARHDRVGVTARVCTAAPGAMLVLGLVLGLGLAVGQGAAWADRGPAIDWATGLVTAEGIGLADRQAPNPAVARGPARRKAEDAARQVLAGALPALPLAAGGTLADQLGDPAIKERVARAVAQRDHGPRGAGDRRLVAGHDGRPARGRAPGAHRPAHARRRRRAMPAPR